MILKRCDRGHYYDGEIYQECPECRGAGQNPYMQMPDISSMDYADEDSVTVALPRSQGHSRQSDMDDDVTVALPRSQHEGTAAGMQHGQRRAGTAGIPRSQERGGTPHVPSGLEMARRKRSQDDDVTAALPRRQSNVQSPGMPQVHSGAEMAGKQRGQEMHGAASVSHSQAVRRQGLKPVVGWLVCVQGSDFGNSFTMKLGRNFIGRSAEMEIVLHGDDSIAMEKHAAVYYVPKQRRFAVEPGTSGRKTYLNQSVVTRPVWIKQHDILTIGSCSLMFFPCCGEHFSWEELIRKRRERNQNL